MSSTVISEGPPVVDVVVDDGHTTECPHCGQKVKLLLKTWEGLWWLVTRPHSAVARERVPASSPLWPAAPVKRIGECVHHHVVAAGRVK